MLTQTKITTKEQKNEEKLKSIVTYSNETENMEQITNNKFYEHKEITLL